MRSPFCLPKEKGPLTRPFLCLATVYSLVGYSLSVQSYWTGPTLIDSMFSSVSSSLPAGEPVIEKM